MGKFEKAKEGILHKYLKYCERGTETTAEAQAELHITTRSSQETKGVTETHLIQEQTKLLRMTKPANPFIFT